jgi:hypothetical protein
MNNEARFFVHCRFRLCNRERRPTDYHDHHDLLWSKYKLKKSAFIVTIIKNQRSFNSRSFPAYRKLFYLQPAN